LLAGAAVVVSAAAAASSAPPLGGGGGGGVVVSSFVLVSDILTNPLKESREVTGTSVEQAKGESLKP
jgi:hypothetical protein